MPSRLPYPALLSSLSLRYQPVVRLYDAHVDYVEVLVRASSANGTDLGPDPVVAAMSDAETSMILTAAIIRRALAEYEAEELAPLPMAVNLPLDVLLHPELATQLLALREATGQPATLLRFELTERHPVHDLEAARSVIEALREAGHALALDDITPDMPYLDALLGLPFSTVKLDRSVVVDPSAAHDEFIRRAVARCAPRGLAIVAEGIETPAHAARALALGATHGQGFLYARPLQAGALRALLAAQPQV